MEEKENVILDYSKLETPYVIRIENTSEDKLYNVPILSDSEEHKGKIRYSMLNGSVTREMFLQALNSISFSTNRLLVYAKCDYRKFTERQLMCYVEFHNKQINGKEYTTVSHCIIHPMQFQSDVVDMKLEKDFNVDSLADIVFGYLMPETTIQVMIYPSKKDNKK